MLIVFSLALLALCIPTNAHSWVEQLTVIAPNGTFVGPPGYPRGFHPRSAGGSPDEAMVHMISSNAESSPIDMCRPSQQQPKQLEGAGDRLQANAGAVIALRYQENGHVTLPENQPGKQPNRGTVYVYGTTQPKVQEKFHEIHKVWNHDGTGGDGRGRLLSVQNYDDGRCYQINTGHISQERQAKYPHTAVDPMGADLWCQTDLQLPSDAPVGKPYTLYWVWDWPTESDVDPNLPDGKIEIYTTCMDVDVVGTASKQAVKAEYVTDQDLNHAAIPEQLAGLGQPPQSQSLSVPTTLVTSAALTGAAKSDTVGGVEIKTLTLTDWVTSTSTVYVPGPSPAPCE